MKQAKTEREAWKVVNKGRKKRGRISEKVREEEWKKYFMRLLGVVEERVIRGDGDGIRKELREEELDRGKVKRTIRRIKEGKAAEADAIPGGGVEIWRKGNGGMDLVGVY